MSIPKKVKALLLNSNSDHTGIVLSWLSEENADYYTVKRGGAFVISQEGPFDIDNSDTIILRLSGGKSQTITLSGLTNGAATAAQVVDSIIDAGLDYVDAYVSQDTDKFVIRSNEPSKHSKNLEIVGGTASAALGLGVGIYWARKNTTYQDVGSTDFETETFEDLDGSPEDFYTVTPYNDSDIAGSTSVYKTLRRHYDLPVNRVVIFGNIYDSTGTPISGSEVGISPPIAKIPSQDQNLTDSTQGIWTNRAKVLTDEDGYFEIEAFAGTKLRLTIPDMDYDNEVSLGTTSSHFTDLQITTFNVNFIYRNFF